MSTNPVNFDIVGCLPQEVGLKVLSNLNAKELAVSTEVGKRWNQLTKEEALKDELNVKTLFKRVSFIDEATWQTKVDLAKYGLSFEGYCVDQCKMIRELQKCLTWPIEKIDGIKPGVTVITLPKGLSVNKLQKLVPPKVFGWVHPEFVKIYGDIEVSDAYTIIITDNVMEETRAKDTKTQLTVIEKHGGARPKAIEAITLLVLTFLISGKRLYGKGRVVLNGEDKELFAYTRCEEQVLNNQSVVGGFGSDGFHVYCNDCDVDCDFNDYGLGAVRKF